MKKIKVGPSFACLILVCLLTNKIVLLINYLSALIFHELAHLFVAFSRGYKLKLLKIDMLGVSVELKEKIDDKDNFAINIAGPLFNLFLCVLCTAFYWLIPSSFQILNTFCLCNLIIAIFNLLPIYPLDGGKIFRGVFQKDKTYFLIDKIIRGGCCFFFLILFVLSFKSEMNLFLLLLGVFFAVSKPKRQQNFSVFKFANKDKVEKIELIKVSENDSLFRLLKMLRKNKYTIFYLRHAKQNYYDEDQIIEYATRYPLTSTLYEIKKS